ncbi:MAG: hypothetical protein ABI406_11140 [Ktedonobacteraceae bacterium]
MWLVRLARRYRLCPGRDKSGPYYSVKLHCAMRAVMLSAAKHLTVRREMLRCTQHDTSTRSFKLDRVLRAYRRELSLAVAWVWPMRRSA